MKGRVLVLSLLSIMLLSATFAASDVETATALVKVQFKAKCDPSGIKKADFNCDGKEDVAMLGKDQEGQAVFVILGPVRTNSSAQRIALSEGDDYQIQVESLDYDTMEEFGENPEGFERSKMCNGLQASPAETDSTHIYWNHKKKEFGTWGL